MTLRSCLGMQIGIAVKRLRRFDMARRGVRNVMDFKLIEKCSVGEFSSVSFSLHELARAWIHLRASDGEEAKLQAAWHSESENIINYSIF